MTPVVKVVIVGYSQIRQAGGVGIHLGMLSVYQIRQLVKSKLRKLVIQRARTIFQHIVITVVMAIIVDLEKFLLVKNVPLLTIILVAKVVTVDFSQTHGVGGVGTIHGKVLLTILPMTPLLAIPPPIPIPILILPLPKLLPKQATILPLLKPVTCMLLEGLVLSLATALQTKPVHRHPLILVLGLVISLKAPDVTMAQTDST